MFFSFKIVLSSILIFISYKYIIVKTKENRGFLKKLKDILILFIIFLVGLFILNSLCFKFFTSNKIILDYLMEWSFELSFITLFFSLFSTFAIYSMRFVLQKGKIIYIYYFFFTITSLFILTSSFENAPNNLDFDTNVFYFKSSNQDENDVCNTVIEIADFDNTGSHFIQSIPKRKSIIKINDSTQLYLDLKDCFGNMKCKFYINNKLRKKLNYKADSVSYINFKSDSTIEQYYVPKVFDNKVADKK